MIEGYTTLGETTLASGYTAGSGTMSLTSGASFPVAGLTFSVRVNTTGAIYTCTRSSNTLTVTLEAGSDVNLSSGVSVVEVVTQRVLNNIRANSVQSVAVASLPSPYLAGTLVFPTDTPLIYRDTGAALEKWGPIKKLGNFQSFAGLTWVNQGTATGDDNNALLSIVALAASGDDLKILKKTATGGTFTFTVRFLANVIGINFMKAGILFRESGTGKLLIFSVGNGGVLMHGDRYASPTSFSNNAFSYGANPLCFTMGAYFRMTYDGTDILFSFSGDGGKTFSQIFSDAKANAFTTAPDEIGIFAGSNNTTAPAAISVLDWVES